VVPLDILPDIVGELIDAHCTFTAEYRARDVWHLGVFQDGARIVTDLLGPPRTMDSQP
jgi:hypothetical protein